MTSRSNLTFAAHVAALALLALAGALAFSDLGAGALPFEGTRRVAVAVYLAVNAGAIELYIAMRHFLMRSSWHFLALIAIYSWSEALFRAVALVDIGLAIAGLFSGNDRLWLLSFAVLGTGEFLLARYLVIERRVAEWTDADIIRFYAQESPRYQAYLRRIQFVYGVVAGAAGLSAIVAGIVAVAMLGTVAYEALVPEAPPTAASLADSINRGVAFVEQYGPSVGPMFLIVLVAGSINVLFTAARAWWRNRMNPTPPPIG